MGERLFISEATVRDPRQLNSEQAGSIRSPRAGALRVQPRTREDRSIRRGWGRVVRLPTTGTRRAGPASAVVPPGDPDGPSTDSTLVRPARTPVLAAAVHLRPSLSAGEGAPVHPLSHRIVDLLQDISLRGPSPPHFEGVIAAG